MKDFEIKRNWRTRLWDWLCPEPWVEEERLALLEIARRNKLKTELQEARVRERIAKVDINIKEFKEYQKWKSSSENKRKICATWRVTWKRDKFDATATYNLYITINNNFSSREFELIDARFTDKSKSGLIGSPENAVKLHKTFPFYTGGIEPWLDGLFDIEHLESLSSELMGQFESFQVIGKKIIKIN